MKGDDEMRTRCVYLGLIALVVAIGCSQNQETTSVTDLGTDVVWTMDNIRDFPLADKDAGDLHNEFLDLMSSEEFAYSEGPLTSAAVPVFERMFIGFGLSAPVIPGVIDSFASQFDGLIDSGMIAFPEFTIIDPDGLTNFLIEVGAYQEIDRSELSEFVHDLADATNAKTSDRSALIEKWQARKSRVSPGIANAVSVMAASADYWSQKGGPYSNADIVAADTGGALVGFFFGGVGSIIGGGIASYAVAISCTYTGDH